VMQRVLTGTVRGSRRSLRSMQSGKTYTGVVG
jgi:hypothetical protein